ncbi:benzoylformate decarboxylase [Ramlibacter rhizophilus]|uniref:Benzoylformate decarboxylase n=1 Tax=Ramlibacter rhizophilus TaxID=1781167 RepID=A0A4Z0BP83_9BURK|nr:benzoylformate decarboxylase [Ramlibacter rhizophilus]TFY99864.1 benzoylformate decarboxylase [Ramlibacter rhizophilus]
MRAPSRCATVREAFYALMRERGSRVIFGNPGSTELPMFRGFPADMDYVLGLQEACVVGMADGYAQATGRAAFVNLHSAAGVGNAMGAIYTAFKNQTPMVIVAGQQYRALQPFDPYLFSRQVTDLPRPYVKSCIEPARAEDVPLAIARAWQTAMQHPRGPAMVSVPADDWERPCAPLPPQAAFQALRPDPAGIEALRRAIGQSERIALVVGAAVDRDGAWDQVVQLAQACQARVFAAPLSARAGFPEDHPLFQGFLPGAGAQIHERLAGSDLVLVVGAPAFTYHVPRGEAASHLPQGARLAVLTDDPEVAAMVPEGLSVLGGIRLGLDELLKDLPARHRTPPPPRGRPAPASPGTPLSTAYVLQTLAALRGPTDIVVEEAPSARPWMQQVLPMTQPASFYTMASGGLGFGMPAAVGIAYAHRDRRVIAVIGDGSSMYSIQSLWTAAQHGLPITFIVLNNGGYAAMKRHAGLLGFEAGEKIVGIDVPGIRFDQLATAQGCAAFRVTEAEALAARLEAALRSTGPSLVEVEVG